MAVAEARQAKHALELREERCRQLMEENLQLQASLRERLVDGRRRLLEVQREVLNGHEQSMVLVRHQNLIHFLTILADSNHSVYLPQANAKREVEGRNEELQRTVEVLSEECRKYELDIQSMKRMLQVAISWARFSSFLLPPVHLSSLNFFSLYLTLPSPSCSCLHNGSKHLVTGGILFRCTFPHRSPTACQGHP